MKIKYYIHLFLLLLIILFTSCDSQKEVSFPHVCDRYGVFSEKELESLKSLDVLGANLYIYTIDTLNAQYAKKYSESIWDSIYIKNDFIITEDYRFDGILILVSKSPNCAYIFYEKNNDKMPVCDEGYASKEYFNVQISDSLNSSRKAFEMVRFAMNSYLIGDDKINSVKSEFIDYFYKYSLPNDSIFYKVFIKTFQKIFLFIENILGFWFAIIVYCFFFYLMKLFVHRNLDRYFVYSNYTSRKYAVIDNIIFNLIKKIIAILIYILPIAFGVVSILNIRCICGVEFINNLQEVENLSINQIVEFYNSSLSKTSLWAAFFATLLFIFSKWKSYYFGTSNSITGFLPVVCCFTIVCTITPIGFIYLIIIMSLLSLFESFKSLGEIDLAEYIMYNDEGKISDEDKIKIQCGKIEFIFLAILSFIINFIFSGSPKFEMPQELMNKQQYVENNSFNVLGAFKNDTFTLSNNDSSNVFHEDIDTIEITNNSDYQNIKIITKKNISIGDSCFIVYHYANKNKTDYYLTTLYGFNQPYLSFSIRSRDIIDYVDIPKEENSLIKYLIINKRKDDILLSTSLNNQIGCVYTYINQDGELVKRVSTLTKGIHTIIKAQNTSDIKIEKILIWKGVEGNNDIVSEDDDITPIQEWIISFITAVFSLVLFIMTIREYIHEPPTDIQDKTESIIVLIGEALFFALFIYITLLDMNVV